MAVDFDNFPLYDQLLKTEKGALTDKMSDVWVASMSSFLQTLTGYLSQNGMFVPRLTTDQRNLIQSAVNGQLIYNTTTNKFQGRENGAWVDLI